MVSVVHAAAAKRMDLCVANADAQLGEHHCRYANRAGAAICSLITVRMNLLRRTGYCSNRSGFTRELPSDT
jgi:hypothetical protein